MIVEILLLWICIGIWSPSLRRDGSLARIAAALEEIERKLK